MFEPIVAAGTEYWALAAGERIEFRHLRTIPSAQFRDALAKGRPVYSFQTLRGYVEEDRRHLREAQPDVVVGDFRLSLSVSARLAGIPYIALSNAYWSPYAKLRMPLPEHPVVSLVGLPLSSALFGIARPAIFAYHSLPMNRLRLRYGLAPLGLDLRRVYTDADYTLYADLPGLVPVRRLPATHGFLGPINWSPRIATPSWWKSVPAGRPLVYVTLGSSGQSALLPIVVQALGSLAVTVILATAGRGSLSEYPGNVLVSEYLPGEEAARLASLVICNGGSPTTYQALSEGKPVIGIASNMDQYLNMSVVQRVGAGRLIRSGLLSSALLRQTVETALCDSAMKEAAQRVKGMIDAYPAGERFASWLRRAVDEHDDRSGRR